MLNAFVLILICVAGLAHLYPDEALAILHGLRYRLCMRRAQRIALDSAQELEGILRERAAQQAIDPEFVNQFLTEQRQSIVSDLEEAYTNQILGDLEASSSLD